MNKHWISLGHEIGEGGQLGREVRLELATLIESRLFAQASSKGGKTHLMRRVCEQTHGQVKQLVFDPEGQLVTLREKFEYVLVGKGGDLPVHAGIAARTARFALETDASFIFDLSEMDRKEKTAYVKIFLDALTEAPQSLWQRILMPIDEAHIFAPEKKKSESAEEMADFCARARKRLFCPMLATQRFAKISKDAVAELDIKLIGKTTLPNDRVRAADELGIRNKDEILALRSLKAGQFHAFGPGLPDGVTLIQTGPTLTQNPKVGERARAALKPMGKDRIAKLLKGVDLAKEAQAEARDREALEKRIRDLEVAKHALERELKQRPVGTDEVALSRARKEGAVEADKKVAYLQGVLKRAQAAAAQLMKALDVPVENIPGHGPASRVDLGHPAAPASRPAPQPASAQRAARPPGAGAPVLGKCARAILSFLAMREGEWFELRQIGPMVGYAWQSGNFSNARGELKAAGLIEQDGTRYSVRPEQAAAAREALGAEYLEPGRHSLEQWLSTLEKCPREVYQLLLREPDRRFTKHELGELTGYAPDSGNFSNALGRLNSLGLIERSREHICLNPEVAKL